MPKPIRRVTDPTVIAVAHLVRLLLDNRTLDNRQLAQETGLTYLTVCRYTGALYHAKAAHVAALKASSYGRESIRVFCLGAGVDALPRTHGEKRAAQQHRLDKRPTRQRTATGMVVSHG